MLFLSIYYIMAFLVYLPNYLLGIRSNEKNIVRFCRDKKNGYTGDRKTQTWNIPWHLVDAHLTGAHKFKTVIFPTNRRLINLIVLLYIHESISFQFCLHIFFVRKIVTNLTTGIFLRILETRTCLFKKKWIRLYSSNYSNSYNWWNHLESLSTPQQISQETKSCAPGDAEMVRLFITEFYYDVKSTFPNWFTCYGDLLIAHLKEQVDDWKVRCLLRKLGSAEHDQYFNYILPKHPRDFTFAETVEILK